MSKLPSINELVNSVKSGTAAQQVKTAAANEVAFNTDLANNVFKLATTIRSNNTNSVTYDDLFDFCENIGVYNG
jgi:hypothetical protein